VCGPCRTSGPGVSVEDQKRADERIPQLLRVPAAVRWISAEPLLGPVDLVSAGAIWSNMNGNIINSPRSGLRGVDWIVAGGESGPGTRPMHPDWARSLRDQCATASVPFLFKQWGAWLPVETDEPGDGDCYAIADDGSDRELSGRHELTSIGMQEFLCVGKKAAGRELDGRTHDEFPEVQ